MDFPDTVFEQLCHEFLIKSFQEDRIEQIGRYWDEQFSLDILGKTKSGKILVGSCKWVNSKIKKSELTFLKERCESLRIEADIFIIFSKNGYTSQLKSLKSDTVQLYTIKDLKKLLCD